MVTYKLKDFAKWARKAGLDDWRLYEAVEEMNCGSLGDRLGAHVFKKRIGISGKGKRGGKRAIVCFKKDDIAIFLYGYAKNEQDNIEASHLLSLRLFAKELVLLSKEDLEEKAKAGLLIKIQETN